MYNMTPADWNTTTSSTLSICKCIVISALEQHSNEIQTKNFTSEPVEGSDPVAVGEKITLKCKEDDAEVGDSMSNQCKYSEKTNVSKIHPRIDFCQVWRFSHKWYVSTLYFYEIINALQVSKLISWLSCFQSSHLMQFQWRVHPGPVTTMWGSKSV